MNFLYVNFLYKMFTFLKKIILLLEKKRQAIDGFRITKINIKKYHEKFKSSNPYWSFGQRP